MLVGQPASCVSQGDDVMLLSYLAAVVLMQWDHPQAQEAQEQEGQEGLGHAGPG